MANLKKEKGVKRWGMMFVLPVEEGDGGGQEEEAVPAPEEDEDLFVEDVDDQNALHRVLLDVGHLAHLRPQKGRKQ